MTYSAGPGQPMPDPAQRFRELFEEHAGRLRAFLANRLPASEVDDALQEVWLRIWRSDWQQVPPQEFRHWALRIARNLVIDILRKHRPDLLEDPEQHLMATAAGPEAVLVEQERTEALGRCLQQLEQEAALVVRERLAGRSYEEISSAYGMAVQRAYKLFHQAKAQLHLCIGGAW